MRQSTKARLDALEAKEAGPVTFIVIIDPDDDRPGIDIDGPSEPPKQPPAPPIAARP